MQSGTLRESASAVGQTLSFGPDAAISLASADPGAVAWIREYFGPSLTAGDGPCAWEVGAGASPQAHAELLERRPADPEPRPWFAFDQSMFSLPSWETEGGSLVGDDAERSCLLEMRPGETEVVAGPHGRRWRFTLVMLIHELVATQLRGDQLEIHASAVAADGRAVLMVGPKRAGKTTLSFHLLRCGLFRSLSNDRAFVGVESGTVAARGVPTSLRVGPAMAAEFPELGDGLPRIDRPHLHSAAELAHPPADSRPPETDELLLSQGQAAAQLGAERAASAPLGALVFPEVDTATRGWSVERLSPPEVAARSPGEPVRDRDPAAPRDRLRGARWGRRRDSGTARRAHLRGHPRLPGGPRTGGLRRPRLRAGAARWDHVIAVTETAPPVEVEIGAALDEHGLGPRRLVPISRFQGRKHGRYAFLALAEDGRKVKARHVVSAEDAQRLCELREGLEPGFAPVLDRHGPVLVEEWIEGVDASEEEAARRAGEAGSLLGRLHAAPSLPPTGRKVESDSTFGPSAGGGGRLVTWRGRWRTSSCCWRDGPSLQPRRRRCVRRCAATTPARSPRR